MQKQRRRSNGHSHSTFIVRMRVLHIPLLIIFCVHIFSFTARAESGSGFLISSASGSIVTNTQSGSIVTEPPSNMSSGSSTESLGMHSSSSSMQKEISPLLVRISEVLWVGSDLSSVDEWFELSAVPALTGSLVTTLPQSLDGWTVTQLKTDDQKP